MQRRGARGEARARQAVRGSKIELMVAIYLAARGKQGLEPTRANELLPFVSSMAMRNESIEYTYREESIEPSLALVDLVKHADGSV